MHVQTTPTSAGRCEGALRMGAPGSESQAVQQVAESIIFATPPSTVRAICSFWQSAHKTRGILG